MALHKGEFHGSGRFKLRDFGKIRENVILDHRCAAGQISYFAAAGLCERPRAVLYDQHVMPESFPCGELRLSQ